jgi:hypothetical protein
MAEKQKNRKREDGMTLRNSDAQNQEEQKTISCISGSENNS